MSLSKFKRIQLEATYQGFADRYGEDMHQLARYCAVPNALTPDLVQTIRVNMRLAASWEDAARYLLTEAVREVDEGIYEMDFNLRQRFVEDFEAKEPGQVRNVARLLLSYYAGILRQGTGHPQYPLARVQQITALAFLDPEAAYEELREEFVRMGEAGAPSERVRMAVLAES